MSEYFGKEIPKLGFGLMRLPKLEDGQSIDIEQTKQMVDLFLDAGMKYFDTAYVYDGGLSEEAAREALVKRYPRESFFLATKLNAHAGDCVDEASAKRQLEISLERTQAGYFDFYLLHALSVNNIGLYDKYQIWDFVKEMKEMGLIRHYGFSFHDKPEVLEDLLTKHPDVEFVQLQINYADWNSPSVCSAKNLEICRKHGKPVVVMEPVKGGTLAAPPAIVADILKAADPDASPASWAIRFVASQDGIMTVLSGMSDLAQMNDNLSYMRDFKPLNEEEAAVIQKAMDALESVEQIPCTSCHYCTAGCPMQIPIPAIFGCMNRNLVFDRLEAARKEYIGRTKDRGLASQCIQCGQCESQCPQHIEIIDWLVKCAQVLE